jgi:hypothetical protein
MGGAVRGFKFSLIVAVALGFAACDRRDSARTDEPAARRAGKAAYNLKQDLKKDAREAADKLRKAGKEAREGWNDAKHEDQSGRKK